MTMTADAGQGLIDACAGTFSTAPGVPFPKLNNDSSPPYANNVLDTAAECGPRPPAKFCNVNGCVTFP